MTTDTKPAAPSPFSATLPTFQTSWDSTSLGWFKKCARLYQYQMLEQWTFRSKSIHLIFGGWYAAGLERYAHYRADGMDHNDAVCKMVRWALEVSGEREHAEGCNAHTPDGACTCDMPFIPWESNDPYKNRYTLIRSLIWNCDSRESSPFRTMILSSGKPAVELSFNFLAFEVANHPISLSGHMDEIVEVNDQIWVRDDKTTKAELNANYFAQYSPNNQMSLYTVAGRIIFGPKVQGVFVRAAQIQVGGTRFANKMVPRPQAVTEEWLGDTQQWVQLAHTYAIANYWPKNDTACNEYGGCPFRKVCSVSPSHRDAWLREDFVRRAWNPLESRGDI